jgi:hypothetical protein
MSENSKGPWGNGDEAEKAAAAEVKLEAGMKTELPKGMRRETQDLKTRFTAPSRESLAAVVQAMAKAACEASDEVDLSTEDEIKRLKGFAERYYEPAHNRFKVGDVVMTSANTFIKGPGKPAIVIEIRECHESDEAIDTLKYPGASPHNPGFAGYGMFFDMRVLRMERNGTVYPMWVESWTQEKWKPAEDKAA